jgi:hypothetical protein
MSRRQDQHEKEAAAKFIIMTWNATVCVFEHNMPLLYLASLT